MDWDAPELVKDAYTLLNLSLMSGQISSKRPSMMLGSHKCGANLLLWTQRNLHHNWSNALLTSTSNVSRANWGTQLGNFSHIRWSKMYFIGKCISPSPLPKSPIHQTKNQCTLTENRNGPIQSSSPPTCTGENLLVLSRRANSWRWTPLSVQLPFIHSGKAGIHWVVQTTKQKFPPPDWYG